MTALISGGVLLSLFFGGITWLVISAKRQGRLEAEAEHNQRAAENAEAMGKVLAESRDADGSGDSDRMRNGSF